MNTRRGFTLLEIVVAVGLLLVLMAGLFAYWNQVTGDRDRIERHMRREQALRVFFQRLMSDIDTCLVGDTVHGTGIDGSPERLRLRSRGVNATGALRGETTTFVDRRIAEYRFVKGSGALQVRGGAGEDAGAWTTLVDGLGDARFRFHDGEEWRDSFDALSARRLPIAIEFAVWFTPDPVDEIEQADDADLDSDDLDIDDALDPDEPTSFELDPLPEINELRPLPDRVRVFVVPDGPEYDPGRSFEDTVGGGDASGDVSGDVAP